MCSYWHKITSRITRCLLLLRERDNLRVKNVVIRRTNLVRSRRMWQKKSHLVTRGVELGLPSPDTWLKSGYL